MSKLEKAVSNSGISVFTMNYKPDFPIEFFLDKNPFSDSNTMLFGSIVHPDDYQPFCEIIGEVVSHRADKIATHARLLC